MLIKIQVYSLRTALDQFESVPLNLNLTSYLLSSLFIVIVLVIISFFRNSPITSFINEDVHETNPYIKSKGLKFYGTIQNSNSTRDMYTNTRMYDGVSTYFNLKEGELSNLSAIAGTSTINIFSHPATGETIYVSPPKSNVTLFECYTYNHSFVQLYKVIKILIEADPCPQPPRPRAPLPLVFFFRETTRHHGCVFGRKVRLYDLSWVTTTKSRAFVYLVQVLFRQLLTTIIKLVFRK